MKIVLWDKTPDGLVVEPQARIIATLKSRSSLIKTSASDGPESRELCNFGRIYNGRF